MRWEAIDVAEPQAGEIRVRHRAIGLNFIDTYHRSGLYQLASLPAVLGMEAAGDVLAVGPDVTDFKPGDRIAYVDPVGSYAEERIMPASRAVWLPPSITSEQAAAMMLQGMTARYLIRQTFVIGPDTTLLIHAAAGGVGLIVCQWARHLGATIIGTAGSNEKCELARAHGATHMINYRTENFVDRVREITNGRGVDVVYDSIGQSTYPASLDCLRPRGLFVTFGNASGPISAITPTALASKGSLYVTRPRLSEYIATREDLLASANDLFDVVSSGVVTLHINQRYPLRDAATAHRDLEARRTTGSTILVP